MDKYLYLFFGPDDTLLSWFSISVLISESFDEDYLRMRSISMCKERGFSRVCFYRCDDDLSSGAVLLGDYAVDV